MSRNDAYYQSDQNAPTQQAMTASHEPYHTSPPQNRILTAKPAATALWGRRVSEAGRVSWEIESAEEVYERVTQASNVSSQTVAILKLSVWSATAVT